MKAGATGYVAEQYYPEGDGMTAIIVSDIQKAMALLGAAFYNYPQNELFIIKTARYHISSHRHGSSYKLERRLP